VPGPLALGGAGQEEGPEDGGRKLAGVMLVYGMAAALPWLCAHAADARCVRARARPCAHARAAAARTAAPPLAAAAAAAASRRCVNCAPLHKGDKVELQMLCLHGPEGRCTNWCVGGRARARACAREPPLSRGRAARVRARCCWARLAPPPRRLGISPPRRLAAS
jgi:hypothetical protein